ncbi:MAG: hypothetical protein KatS3mg087_0469 [Patescibacteria group bacterium]|nr:MAG: hypothetical protein KatS3mg087_0469 [Patescibacteria group bacterium]
MRGLTVMSALPIFRREIIDADGNKRYIYSKRSVTIEDVAGVGKTSFIKSFPYWLRFIDGDSIKAPRVFDMSARMVGDPPMNILEIGSKSASEPLLWKELVLAVDAAEQGHPAIFMIDELYALPDYHAPQFLHSLQGLTGMERVAVVACTNPRGYYSDELTMHPNLAQRFGYPIRQFQDDPLFAKSFEMYRQNRYEAFYLPYVVNYADVQEQYDYLRKMIEIGVNNFAYEQKDEAGKYVSRRSCDWAAEQMVIASKILDVNAERGAMLDVLGEVISEHQQVAPMLPADVASSILEVRLGPAAASQVMSVFNKVRPFDVSGFLKIFVKKGVSDSQMMKEADAYISEYLSDSPVKQLSVMIIVRSFAKLGSQIRRESRDDRVKRLVEAITAIARVYSDKMDKVPDYIRITIGAIADYLVKPVPVIVQQLPANVSRFYFSK